MSEELCCYETMCDNCKEKVAKEKAELCIKAIEIVENQLAMPSATKEGLRKEIILRLKEEL